MPICRLAVRDQAQLGGGAAHVEGQHARLTDLRAYSAAATAPAAGPDSISRTGVRDAVALGTTPPLDVIHKHLA